MTNSEIALIFLDGLSNIEYKHKRNIIDSYNDIGSLISKPEKAINYLSNCDNKSSANIFKSAIENKYYDTLIKNYKNSGITVITEESDNYPKRLYEIDCRPICLYCKGNISLLNSNKTFSIVGSRKTMPQYLKLAQEYSNTLANNGVTIVTGVALGGYTSGILGSIDSGNLICVLAGGFDFVNSEVNHSLIEKVICKGLVITEYTNKVPTLAYHYPIRNRIIAGLGDGVLIVSGSQKSGARYTANYATEYGKDVFCFPYTVGVSSGELCNSLIKDGAYLTDNILDITNRLAISVSSKKIELNDIENQIVEIIKSGITLVDDISLKTNLKIYELIPILTSLELKGVIVRNNGNEYSCIK